MIKNEDKYLQNSEERISVSHHETGISITNEAGTIIVELDKKNKNIKLLSEDNLIAYGYDTAHREVRYGYLDLDGNILTDAIFWADGDGGYRPQSFKGKDILAIQTDYDSYGLVNRNFDTLIPFDYDKIKVVNDKYVVAEKYGDSYLFDVNGKFISNEVPEAFKI
jgi:hypothetical protein